MNEEYYKQLKRIERALKKLEKEGFIFDTSPIPKKPKRITQASVNKLRKITPEKLREKSEYILNDKVVKYKSHKKEVKEDIKKIKKQLDESYNIPKVSYIQKFKEQVNQAFENIDRFKDEVTDLPDYREFYHGRGEPITYLLFTGYKQLYISILDDRIAENGEEFMEQLLFENSDKLSDKFDAIRYDSDEQRVRYDLESVIPIIKGTPMSHEEAEQVANLSDYYYSEED